MLGITSRLETLPTTNNGLDAVRETRRRMVALARKYSADETTIVTATAIIRAAGITDVRTARYQTNKAIQNWVRDRIGYAFDPLGTEMIQTPPATLKRGYGDCDDKAILVAAMLTALGFETEFLAVGGTGQGWQTQCSSTPGELPEYSHVLAGVRYGAKNGRLPPFLDGWLPLETIVPGVGPGWLPRGVRVIMPAHV